MLPCFFLAVTIIAAEQLRSFCRKIRRRYHWYYKVIRCFPWSRTKKNTYLYWVHIMCVSVACKCHNQAQPELTVADVRHLVWSKLLLSLLFPHSGTCPSTPRVYGYPPGPGRRCGPHVLPEEAPGYWPQRLPDGNWALETLPPTVPTHPLTTAAALGSAWGTPARTPRWSWVCSHRWSSSSLRPFHCTPASPRQ